MTVCVHQSNSTSDNMKQLFYICVLSFAITTMAEDINVDEVIHDANNKFTANFFYAVAKLNPNQNVVLSAFSVMPPLALLAFASVAESHDELLNAIGMPNDNVTNAVFSQLDSKLRSTKGVTLNTASKIYIADNYNLNNDFAANAKHTFGSEVKNVNFRDNQAAANEVNGWVEEQTNHKIKNLVNPKHLDHDTRALLVNAIYFKAAWKDSFSKYSTTDRDFHVTKDRVIKVPTMHERGFYKYAESSELKAQILEIPYFGDESSFVIVLPRDITGIVELIEKLKDPKVLDKATQDTKNINVDVYIPKFKIETTTDLKEVLEKLNVKRLFSPNQARLENLLKNSDKLYVDSATQKTFIEINEDGSEATAASNFIIPVVKSASINFVKPPVFNADRPFYFEIKVKKLTVFSGIIQNL